MSDERKAVGPEDEEIVCIVKQIGDKKLTDVLNNEFMEKYTNFHSFRELTFSSMVWIDWEHGDVVMTRKSLLDHFIDGSTQFSTWDEMYRKADAEYEAKKRNKM